MAGRAATVAGTYTNMRSWLGLAPKPVTSCSDAAAEGRAGAATSSAIAATRGTAPRASLRKVFFGMRGPPVHEGSLIHVCLCAGADRSGGSSGGPAVRCIVPGGGLLNRESSGGQVGQDLLEDLSGARRR